MTNQIPYGKHYITEADIQSVVDVLKSNFLTQGSKVPEFENAFAQYIGCKYAVAVANGTAALHLSALALDLTSQGKVITTPITFAASANCVRYCGGEVVFADIDPETYLLDINRVETLLRKSNKGEYMGIIPVDFAGRSVDLEAYRKLADQYGLWIIEDACHSPGGYFIDSSGEKQNCGNGRFAELSVFSFHPVKHITTGEGGMITTNDEELYKKLLMLRSHGITRDPMVMKENHGAWYMEMQTLGFNYRLTDIQAALGISQMNSADGGVIKRKEIARLYNEAFAHKPFIKGHSGVINGHAYHLYVIEVENRLGLYNYLRENNIFAQVHYIPCHLMPYYRQFGWGEGDMPNAEHYYKHCISLPMFPTLTSVEQEFVIEKILEFYS
jgi:UDP-4-amino-4,6-dideoxy-N-acetyl-beta-L-altrosamine transaminase